MNDTCWSDWEEWRQVFALAYSHEFELKRRACHFMAMWSLRGKLPLPVKCTWDLLEAQLLDASQFASLEQIRLCYATAIVRLINISTEDIQRGEYALPVSQLAAKIGLEKWIVDVRHDCAHHNNLPGVQVLRLASNRLMDWLQTEYWQLQSTELDKGESDSYLKQRLVQLARIVDLGEGEMKRESGPQLPPSATTTNNKGEEQDTALDIVESIRDFEVGRLSRQLLLVLLSAPKVMKWKQVMQWLDGSGTTFRVSHAVLALCFKELLTAGREAIPGLSSIARLLLSRSFCSDKREYLAKLGNKQLAVEETKDLSSKEIAFLQDFAPDVYQKELRVLSAQCLLPTATNGIFVLRELILPSLRATANARKSGSSSNNNNDGFIKQLEMLTELRATASNGQAAATGGDANEAEAAKWRALDEFCQQFEDVSATSTPAPAAAAAAGAEKSHVVRTSLSELKPNGTQEWTRVEWYRRPLGMITHGDELATFVKVSSTSNRTASTPPQEEDDEQAAATSSGKATTAVNVPAVRKRIKLLI